MQSVACALLFLRSLVSKAWDPNSAATFCGQFLKQAYPQGHKDNSNDKALAVAGCEAKVAAKLSSCL